MAGGRVSTGHLVLVESPWGLGWPRGIFWSWPALWSYPESGFWTRLLYPQVDQAVAVGCPRKEGVTLAKAVFFSWCNHNSVEGCLPSALPAGAEVSLPFYSGWLAASIIAGRPCTWRSVCLFMRFGACPSGCRGSSLHMEKTCIQMCICMCVVARGERREAERPIGKLITSVQVSDDETLSKDRGTGDVEDFRVNESNHSRHLFNPCHTADPLTYCYQPPQ